MSLDNLVPRVGSLALLVLGLGFALVLSSCASQPNLGQAPSTSATANVTPTTPLEHRVLDVLGTTPAPGPTETVLRQLTTELFSIFYRQPGTILAQGTNQTPVGLYPLKSYRLEEVTLPRLMSFATNDDTHQLYFGDEVTLQGPILVRGKKIIAISKIYRLTITGGPFVETNFELWPITTDKIFLGNGATDYGGPDGGYGIKIILSDLSVLPEGSVLSLSGSKLPEKVQFTRNR